MDTLNLVMLLLLPALLVLSGFFSGSETALFAMTEMERMHLRKRGSLGIVRRAVDSLLREPRMLLITVLLGNMVVNVTYFVISSVLLLRIEPGALGGTLLAIGTLLGMILFGEVLPKMTANAHRVGFASVVAPPLLAIHNVIAPLRVVLDHVVVSPLSRLTAPAAGAPPRLDREELAALLETSGRQGAIDPQEQRILREVVNMSHLRVRDVMTPRVRMAAIPIGATRDEVLDIAREFGRRALPVYSRDLDTIIGILDVRAWLLQTRLPQHSAGSKPARLYKSNLRRFLNRPNFVPQIATLDKLLQHFRRTGTRSAIVVDEYGGTAGIVSIQDVVERLVGEFGDETGADVTPPHTIGFNEWEAHGNMSVHDWADAFGQQLVSPRVATLGGLIIDKLGRAPDVGDTVQLGNVELEVAEIDRSRVVRAIVRLREEQQEAEA